MQTDIAIDNIAHYTLKNHKLTPLRGKIPVLPNWTDRTLLSNDQLAEYIKSGLNLGWVLGDKDLVVDVDPRNGGSLSFLQLEEDLNITIDKTVKTIGGFHCYLNHDGGLKLSKSLKKYPGIDFLTKGNQCVIAGSGIVHQGKVITYDWHDDNIFACFTQNPAPKALIDILLNNADNSGERPNGAEEADLGGLTGLVGTDEGSWTDEEITVHLKKLDPSMSNDSWVKVGMALHSYHPIDGLALWDDWSLDGDNYKKGECALRWRSFDSSSSGVTMGTLVHMAKEAAYSQAESKKDDYIQQINSADEKTISIKLVPMLRKDDMPEGDREQIAQVIKARLKILTGTATSIAIVRKQLKPSYDLITEKPEWCQGWVYVAAIKEFVRLKNMLSMPAEAFNILQGRNVPLSENGTSKITAVRYVADNGLMDIADKTAYLPNEQDTIVERSGATYLNTFDRNSVPKEADSFTPEGLEAIEMVKRHIKFVCGTDENALILTQWIAHQIQFTGELVHWAPIIQSIEGIGKSFFAQLFRECLGGKHVGVVSPRTIAHQFNDYATGVAVNVVEELRIVGHNRHEASNAIKPLLTDKIINVEPKGTGSFTTYNTTNYICFTNFKDAIPLTLTDRRWWVIFVDINNKEDFKSKTGKHSEDYFPELFGSIEDHAGELRKWLLEYTL